MHSEMAARPHLTCDLPKCRNAILDRAAPRLAGRRRPDFPLYFWTKRRDGDPQRVVRSGIAVCRKAWQIRRTLVRAYEKRGSFRAGADLRVWLLSIMHNIFIDGTRARGAEAQRLKRAGELVERLGPPFDD
jgi:hypothetical protein